MPQGICLFLPWGILVDHQLLALTIVLARDTGAELSNWEHQFCDSLAEILERDYFYLSPAQIRSLIRLGEKLDMVDHGHEPRAI